MIPAALLTLFTEEMAIAGSLTWLREFLSESRYMTEERERERTRSEKEGGGKRSNADAYFRRRRIMSGCKFSLRMS
jgi:hypothetical protein